LNFPLPYRGFPENDYNWKLGEFGHFSCNEGSDWYSNAAMLLSKSKPVIQAYPVEKVMDSDDFSCVYSKKGKKTVLNTDNYWKGSKSSMFATVEIAMFK